MRYPNCSDWPTWLRFDNDSEADIDPGFRGRLAAYARDVLKRPLVFASGYRTLAEQQALYDAYLDGRGNVAAKPGTSWHEFHEAVDIRGASAVWPEIMADFARAPAQQAMAAFGICVPMWSGASTKEWWHLQPIETIGYAGDKAEFRLEDDMLKQGDNSPAVLAWQNALVAAGFPLVTSTGAIAAPNSNFGPATLSATNKFKASVGLPQDGVVDEPTQAKMLDTLRAKWSAEVHACEALQAAQAAQLTTIRSDLDTCKARIIAAKSALG